MKETVVTADLIVQQASKWEHYYNVFWTNFRREYLNRLRVFHKNDTPQQPLFVGQLVLVDSLFKRSKFRLGLVQKITTNRSDDQVRTVGLLVKTDHGVDKWTSWPANRVIPLELERPLPVVKIEDVPEQIQDNDQRHEDVDDQPHHEEAEKDPEEGPEDGQQPQEEDEPP